MLIHLIVCTSVCSVGGGNDVVDKVSLATINHYNLD